MVKIVYYVFEVKRSPSMGKKSSSGSQENASIPQSGPASEGTTPMAPQAAYQESWAAYSSTPTGVHSMNCQRSEVSQVSVQMPQGMPNHNSPASWDAGTQESYQQERSRVEAAPASCFTQQMVSMTPQAAYQQSWAAYSSTPTGVHSMNCQRSEVSQVSVQMPRGMPNHNSPASWDGAGTQESYQQERSRVEAALTPSLTQQMVSMTPQAASQQSWAAYSSTPTGVHSMNCQRSEVSQVSVQMPQGMPNHNSPASWDAGTQESYQQERSRVEAALTPSLTQQMVSMTPQAASQQSWAAYSSTPTGVHSMNCQRSEVSQVSVQMPQGMPNHNSPASWDAAGTQESYQQERSRVEAAPASSFTQQMVSMTPQAAHQQSWAAYCSTPTGVHSMNCQRSEVSQVSVQMPQGMPNHNSPASWDAAGTQESYQQERSWVEAAPASSFTQQTMSMTPQAAHQQSWAAYSTSDCKVFGQQCHARETSRMLVEMPKSSYQQAQPCGSASFGESFWGETGTMH